MKTPYQFYEYLADGYAGKTRLMSLTAAKNALSRNSKSCIADRLRIQRKIMDCKGCNL
jgi:hypothetical protein